MMRPPSALASGDRRRRTCGDAIGLVERQFQVEHGIAGRGDAGGKGERGEADAALAPGLQRAPVEREAGRRRFERDRVGGDRRPHIPQSQRLRDMRVLDRPAVPRQSGQQMRAAADEAQLDKARVAGKTLHDGVQRPEPEAGRPATRQAAERAVFRARAMIAGAEGDGDEAGGIADRQPAGEPDLDRLAARQMRAE